MKGALVLLGVILLGLFGLGDTPDRGPEPAPAATVSWKGFAGTFGPGAPRSAAPESPSVGESPGADGVDVVDAHWMALTMWGEARGEGESAMRAVGHVIANRAQRRPGAWITDTVDEKWQFSCWNAGDPNRARMLAIDTLPPDGDDRRMWETARRLAAEILEGRSADPTKGALFYHHRDVAPAWSRGIAPDAVLGNHLFFRSAR